VSKNTIPIVFISDDNYAMPTAVAITSLWENKDTQSIYDINILSNRLSYQNRILINSLNKPNFNVQVIELSDHSKYDKFRKKKEDTACHVSPTSLYKFDLPQIFYDHEKILYLDSDIIIQKDILPLLNLNIEGKYAAVVKDMKPTTNYNVSQLKKLKLNHSFYFNSGVMLLNLRKMRQDNISSQLIEYKKNGTNYFMDQDAFNVIFKENVLYTSFYNNLIYTELEKNTLDKVIRFYDLSPVKSRQELYTNANILHLASKYKPWIYNIPYFSDLFRYYYSKSTYAKTNVLPDTLEKLDTSKTTIRYELTSFQELFNTFSMCKRSIKEIGIKKTLKKVEPFLLARKEKTIFGIPHRILLLLHYFYNNIYHPILYFTLSLPRFSALNKAPRDKKIIVSLTTYPARINAAIIVLGILLRQTCKPDKILLYLGKDQFEGKNLPLWLQLQKKCGIEIIYCDDLKPHKKYFYTMQKYPDDLVITVDDDIIYNKDLIDNLYKSYNKYPNAVSACRTHLITFDEEGKINPYTKWKFCYSEEIDQPRMNLFATGVGGVLYPLLDTNGKILCSVTLPSL